MTKRLYAVHFIKFMTYSLDARSSGGNVENTRYENSLCRLLIHYHTLLLPIHDLKKGGRGWACHFYFARWFRFMLTLLGHIILNKDKEKKLKYAENNCRRPYIKQYFSGPQSQKEIYLLCCTFLLYMSYVFQPEKYLRFPIQTILNQKTPEPH